MLEEAVGWVHDRIRLALGEVALTNKYCLAGIASVTDSWLPGPKAGAPGIAVVARGPRDRASRGTRDSSFPAVVGKSGLGAAGQAFSQPRSPQRGQCGRKLGVAQQFLELRDRGDSVAVVQYLMHGRRIGQLGALDQRGKVQGSAFRSHLGALVESVNENSKWGATAASSPIFSKNQ